MPSDSLAGARLPTYIVDAFSARPFGGNQAAVCLVGPAVSSLLSDADRQKIASEMNLSETAFLEPSSDSQASDDAFAEGSTFGLRWFTPTCEVPLCGHATLAAAAVLMQACGNASPSLTFRTRHSGELTVRRSSSAAAAAGGKAADGKAATGPLQLELSLPRYEPADAVPSCAVDPTGPLILACTGGLPVFEVLFAGQGLNYLLVVLAEGTSREQLEGVVPDKAAMLAACPQGGQLSGVIVSACGGGGSGYDALSRFFAPFMGIDEDPVTGSAHAVLGPYWGGRLGKERLQMRQCSARGGDVAVALAPASGSGRVLVSGPATIVLHGMLVL